MSVAPVDFGAPPAPRPAWFPAAARRLAAAPAAEVLAWAVATFGANLSVACSMQDAVLVDLAVRADPQIEVVFLDTGFHFAETLETAWRLRARYDLNLVTLRPDGDATTYRTGGIEACCEARTVAPLDRHLAGRAAW
ncbi:MAG TPA: phosphoadenosine phosphosulfate reductase family protein, partial [Acidimicrobiia bacterium]|nr:phosphoadenosine phosphosulfate reductase family protein [Acidimicrobiia bacterium]